MARSNTASTSNYFNDTFVTGITSNPISMSCWFYPFNLTSTSNLVAISNASVSSYHALIFDGANSYALGDNCIVIDNATAQGVSASAVAAANTWNHAAAVTSSNTSRKAYLNGVGGTANTTSVTPSGYDHANIACLRSATTTFSPLDGRIAEVGIWNVALTDAEILMLSKGVSPLMVRPNNLQRYWPLWGAGAEADRIFRSVQTMTGTMAKAEHCPVFYPTGPVLIGLGSSSANKTLAAGAASYAITATAASPLLKRVVTAGAASYAITSTAAALRRNLPIVAGSTSYAISSTAAVPTQKRIATAGAASYAITSTAASTLLKRVLAAGAASYAISAQAVTLTKSSATAFSLAAGAFSYAITSTAASLLQARKVVAGAASYAITSTPASVLQARKIIAAATSYSITSTPATARLSRLLTAANTNYAITAQPVTLTYSGAPPAPANEGSHIGQMATMNRWMGR